MRSILAIFNGSFDGETLSGGDRHALEVWSGLGGLGYTVDVVASGCGLSVVRRFGYELSVHPTSASCVPIGTSRLQYVGRLLLALKAILGERPREIVYAGSGYFYDVLPALFLKATKRASCFVVPVFHLVPSPATRQGNRLKNVVAWIEQRVMCALIGHFADLVIVDNDELVEQLPTTGIPAAAIFKTAMGVREASSAPDAPAYDAVYVGRLTHAKGIIDLLDAWARVRGARPARLAIIGRAEPDIDVAALLAQRGLQDAVDLYPDLGDAQVAGFLRVARLFVTASHEEGYGLAVLEALSVFTPCVTYALPAFHEAFPFGRAEVPIGDIDAFAGAVLRLLEDEPARLRLREEIRRGSLPKSWRVVASEMAAVIERRLPAR